MVSDGLAIKKFVDISLEIGSVSRMTNKDDDALSVYENDVWNTLHTELFWSRAGSIFNKVVLDICPSFGIDVAL